MIQGRRERSGAGLMQTGDLANLLRALPMDARDRIRLVDALTIASRAPGADAFRVQIDGEMVQFEVDLIQEDEDLHGALLTHFGDVRCLDRESGPMLKAQFYRDGRRDGSDCVVAPNEAWPRSTLPLAVDFDRTGACPVERFESLWNQATMARHEGRVVYFLNVPSHLRMLADGRGAEALAVVRRDFVGPRLPDVLAQALPG